jgi:pimeloyl-ACP methyl ester carboxylesterase
MRAHPLHLPALAVPAGAALLLAGLALLPADLAPARAAVAHDAAPAAVAFVHADGAKIAYRDINRTAHGVPLLLIIGYGSTMAEWDPQLVAQLARHRRVVMFDNRGTGASTGSVAHLTVRLMAADAAGLIRRLKLGRTDVLGWSMGGFIAQELALDHPALVGRLILASTDPGSPHTTTASSAVIRTLTNPTATAAQQLSILFPPDQLTAAHTWLSAIASQPGVTPQDFAVPAATEAAQTVATSTLWLTSGHGTYARLPQIGAPTLVAYGAEDVIVPPSNAQILIDRIPHARGVRFSNAGHAFLFQDPDAAAHAFTAFLAFTAR